MQLNIKKKYAQIHVINTQYVKYTLVTNTLKC